jgi:hypothetical protein
MDAQIGSDNRDAHVSFRDQCLLYGDFNRAVFLEQIVAYFLSSASKEEIAQIRKIIQAREKIIKAQGGKKGRPRAMDSSDWVRKAFRITWRREILGLKWSEISIAEGLKPTRTNLWTLQRQRDEYARLIWIKLPHFAHGPGLNAALEVTHIQSTLRRETGLPFKSHPEECKKLVRAVEPRGLRVQGLKTRQRVERIARKTSQMLSTPQE